jgi:hypothetical protein
MDDTPLSVLDALHWDATDASLPSSRFIWLLPPRASSLPRRDAARLRVRALCSSQSLLGHDTAGSLRRVCP